MTLGPLLGDVLLGGHEASPERMKLLFIIPAGLGLAALACAVLSTRGDVRPAPRRHMPLAWLLRRYHPGSILVMGVMMGVGFSLPTTFLATFAAELQIAHVGGYFIVYAATAFLARIATRSFPARYGIRPMIDLGVAATVISLLLYLPVHTQYGLMIPGVFAGIGHALLFPAIVAGGSAAFPDRYRGLGTTVMLASMDMGTLVGAPLVGGIVYYSKLTGWPPYPTMFVTLAIGMTVIAVAERLWSLRRGHESR